MLFVTSATVIRSLINLSQSARHYYALGIAIHIALIQENTNYSTYKNQPPDNRVIVQYNVQEISGSGKRSASTLVGTSATAIRWRRVGIHRDGLRAVHDGRARTLELQQAPASTAQVWGDWTRCVYACSGVNELSELLKSYSSNYTPTIMTTLANARPSHMCAVHSLYSSNEARGEHNKCSRCSIHNSENSGTANEIE